MSCCVFLSDRLVRFVCVSGPESVDREPGVRQEVKRIERPPPTMRVTPDGQPTEVPTALLPPLATAESEEDWLERKKREEQVRPDRFLTSLLSKCRMRRQVFGLGKVLLSGLC